MTCLSAQSLYIACTSALLRMHRASSLLPIICSIICSWVLYKEIHAANGCALEVPRDAGGEDDSLRVMCRLVRGEGACSRWGAVLLLRTQ